MSDLQLRLAQHSDLEAIAALEVRAMHFPMGHRVREWLTSHPTMTASRIAVAQDGDVIVAAVALVPEPFLYGGVPLETGVWDAVATEERHRRRGLCRDLMARLEAEYQPVLLLVEGATAVYRRLGYDPAFPNRGGCNSGGALVRVADIPVAELWSVRRARPNDADWLAALRRNVAEKSLLAAAPDEAAWRHSLREDRSVVGPEGTSLNLWQITQVLMAPDGTAAGFFVHDPWGTDLLMEMELLPGHNFRDAGTAVLHALAASSGAGELKLALPDDHPLLQAFPLLTARRDRGGSDWHARIPNLSAFLTAIAPVLEKSLTASPLAGWRGEIVLSRGRDAVRIARSEALSFVPETGDDADVRLTEAAFISLVMGQATLLQLMEEDRDNGGSDEGVAVLQALFSKRGRVFAKSI